MPVQVRNVVSHTISGTELSRVRTELYLVKDTFMDVGDHILVVGRVARFSVNRRSKERPLLSMGPNTRRFRILARRGRGFTELELSRVEIFALRETYRLRPQAELTSSLCALICIALISCHDGDRHSKRRG